MRLLHAAIGLSLLCGSIMIPAGETSAQVNRDRTEQCVTHNPLARDDEVEAAWALLDLLTSFLCMLVDCTGEPWRAPATSQTSSQVVTKRMETQITSYTANGVKPGLTEPEKTTGITDAEATRDHILASPGLLEPALESAYLGMLSEIIDDLSD